jgi:hypothetical protein
MKYLLATMDPGTTCQDRPPNKWQIPTGNQEAVHDGGPGHKNTKCSGFPEDSKCLAAWHVLEWRYRHVVSVSSLWVIADLYVLQVDLFLGLMFKSRPVLGAHCGGNNHVELRSYNG